MEITHREVKVNADSITLGSPTNGQLKVYGDFSKPEEFAEKIKRAQELLEQAKNGGPA
jgi:hypothetical protein